MKIAIILSAIIASVSFTPLTQAQDLSPEELVKKGQKVSAKCKACHSFKQGGKNKVGPALWGIFERPAGEVEGFKYSKALLARKGELTWTEENLDGYLKKPRKFLPKGKMAFAGIKKDEDRKALIEYLKTLK